MVEVKGPDDKEGIKKLEKARKPAVLPRFDSDSHGVLVPFTVLVVDPLTNMMSLQWVYEEDEIARFLGEYSFFEGNDYNQFWNCFLMGYVSKHDNGLIAFFNFQGGLMGIDPYIDKVLCFDTDLLKYVFPIIAHARQRSKLFPAFNKSVPYSGTDRRSYFVVEPTQYLDPRLLKQIGEPLYSKEVTKSRYVDEFTYLAALYFCLLMVGDNLSDPGFSKQQAIDIMRKDIYKIEEKYENGVSARELAFAYYLALCV
jgi:hypothetical protein